jgi:hypothetical protein
MFENAKITVTALLALVIISSPGCAMDEELDYPLTEEEMAEMGEVYEMGEMGALDEAGNPADDAKLPEGEDVSKSGWITLYPGWVREIPTCFGYTQICVINSHHDDGLYWVNASSLSIGANSFRCDDWWIGPFGGLLINDAAGSTGPLNFQASCYY